MIAALFTFLSEKIVALVMATIVVVAAVPTLIIAVSGNAITITTAASGARASETERARIIREVREAANAVIVRLDSEEASCDSQIAELASRSKVSATATTTRLETAKHDFHQAVAPFLDELEADQEGLEALTVVTADIEQTFLIRIDAVQRIALGEDGHAGALVVLCQAIVVEIAQGIESGAGGGADGDREASLSRPET